MLFWLTVRLWIESPRHCPFGGCSLAHCANSGKVSLLQVPHLNAQVTPALHYFCAPLHRPPAHPLPFAIHKTVPVTGRDKRTVIETWLFKPPPELGQQEWRGELQILLLLLLLLLCFVPPQATAYISLWLDLVTFQLGFFPPLFLLWCMLQSIPVRLTKRKFNTITSTSTPTDLGQYLCSWTHFFLFFFNLLTWHTAL